MVVVVTMAIALTYSAKAVKDSGQLIILILILRYSKDFTYIAVVILTTTL